MDYKTKYNKILSLISKKEYSTCIMQSGFLFEKSLKQLLPTIRDNQNEKEKYRLEFYLNDHPRPLNRFTFGDYSKMYDKCKLWQVLSKSTVSNQIKSRSIPWQKIVAWRNDEVHGNGNDDEHEKHDKCIVITTWLKYFLLDTELIRTTEDINEDQSVFKDTNCKSCNTKMKDNWRFCPQCGDFSKFKCKKCKKSIDDSSLQICPYCDEQLENPFHRKSKLFFTPEEEYENLCKGCWFDGVVNIRERQHLDFMRRKLGISYEKAQEIERPHANLEVLEYTKEVEKIISDGEITAQDREHLKICAKKLGVDPWIQREVENNIRQEFNERSKSRFNPNDEVWTPSNTEF